MFIVLFVLTGILRNTQIRELHLSETVIPIGGQIRYKFCFVRNKISQNIH